MSFDNVHRESIIEMEAPPTSAASNENNPIGEVAVSHTTPPTSPESKSNLQQQNATNAASQAVVAEEETKPQEPQKAGRPQVIVRIRPSSCKEDNIFEVDEEGKTLLIKVEKEMKPSDPRHNPFQCGHTFINFPSDGVLDNNSSQEDTFKTAALEIVDKAMEGISGIVVAVGPEGAGKTFTLFGLSGKYANRGIAGRMIEKAFEYKEKKASEITYRLGLGIIELRRERIRDLVTLSPYEINEVGDHGPKGMHVEEMESLEHGIGILLRALIGQKMIHKEPYELYHTIMYLEIVALSPEGSGSALFRSRITLAEIAAAPPKTRSRAEPPMPNDSWSSYNRLSESSGGGGGCMSSYKIDFSNKSRGKSSLPVRSSKCVNPAYSSGPLAESIAVRRDIFALEQIFLKANEIHRIKKYFSKLEELGLSMIASEKRKLSNNNNFRQSRLAHCLKDIMDGNTEIRILLHVIPSKSCLKSSLEAMRFAERAKLVPTNSEEDIKKGKKDRAHEQILQEVITEIAPELTHPSHVESLNSEKMKAIQEQAIQYFENNIDGMKVCSKDKVKQMFENFRVLWNFLFELELNVNLRKAEEEFRNNLETQGISYNNKRRSSMQAKDASSDGGGDRDEEGQHHHSKPEVKKSSRKIKKDKEKKKKKDKAKKDSQEFKPVNLADTTEHKDSLTNLGEPTDETATPKSPEDEEEELPAPPSEPNLVIPEQSSLTNVSTKDAMVQQVTITDVELGSHHGRTSKDQGTQFGAAEAAAVSAAATKHSIVESNAELLKSPAGVAFGEFKFGASDATSQQDMTEEERTALIARMEEQFEEMKKVAKRQAIHLLRAGVKRPQWMSLF